VNYVLQIWMLFSDAVFSESEGVTGYWILRGLQFVSSFLVLALLMNVRHKLRDMYSITEETDASACCLVYCCSPCTISQEARHIARVKGELPWPIGQGPQQGVIIGYPIMPSTVVQAGQVPVRSPVAGQAAAMPDPNVQIQYAQPQVIVAQPLPAQRGNVAQVWPDMPVAQATIAPGAQTEPLPAGAVMGMPPQGQQQEQQRFQQQFQAGHQQQQPQPLLATMAVNHAAGQPQNGQPQNGSSARPRYLD
jgi:Cys-rich protein (TIGR01571 family)